MHPGVTILYRGLDGLWTGDESDAARAHFITTDLIGTVRPRDLVIPRYSALPLYRQMERELALRGARPINSYAQHGYVADVSQWYYDLWEITPQTWPSLAAARRDGYSGPFVLKGMTNSIKFLWDTHMYAEGIEAATTVWNRLLDDTMIGSQGVVFREYRPIEHLLTGIRGLPVGVEHRFFFLHGRVLCGGYYWASHTGDLEDAGTPIPDPRDVPRQLLEKIAGTVTPKCPFFVADVALGQDGTWFLVELNDGQMSGLSCCDPEVLYANMASVLYRGYSSWFSP